MTKQEQNMIILQHMDAELKDKPDISERIGRAFNQWFQALIVPPAPPTPPQEGEQL